MNKIDTTNWKEFKIGDYFTQERGKEKAPNQAQDGDTPLIKETGLNNGFDKFVDPTKVFKGNAITISINYAQNVFYQPDDFCASVNIVILRNDYINKYSGLFIVSVLRNVNKKYDYIQKTSKDIINNEIIKLPATKEGEPDYEYMENYIKELIKKKQQEFCKII